MKVKKFNEIQSNKSESWLVSLKRPNLEISLEKIGMDKSIIKQKAKSFREKGRMSNRKKLYVRNYHGVWDVTFIRYDDMYKYLGEVDVTPEEIEQYYLKKDSEKYNL